MGLFSRFNTNKDIKEIENLINKISSCLNDVESAKRGQQQNIPFSEYSRCESNCSIVVEAIIDADSIRKGGDMQIINQQRFYFNGLRRSLDEIISKALKQVIIYREMINEPPVYQEENYIFSKYLR